ncbi:MAG TPA: hypothetical protein VGB67_16350 [Fibrella sp.]
MAEQDNDIVQIVMTRRVAGALGLLARSTLNDLPPGPEIERESYTPSEWTAINGVIESLCLNVPVFDTPPKANPDNVILPFGGTS